MSDLTTSEYLGVACAYLRGLNSPCRTAEEGDRAAALLEADAQALADVRTLDGWQSNFAWVVKLQQWLPTGDWICTLEAGDEAPRSFRASSPEGARAKAAEWVRKQAATTSEGLK